MRLNPYLSFDGTCAEAFAFYEKCFGAKTTMSMTYRDSPMADHSPPDFLDKIMHTNIDVGGVALMGSDAPPGRYAKAAGITVSIVTHDEAEAERVFAALSEGGQVSMPLQQTFWAHRFGTLTDRFGTPWMVNCDKPPA